METIVSYIGLAKENSISKMNAIAREAVKIVIDDLKSDVVIKG